MMYLSGACWWAAEAILSRWVIATSHACAAVLGDLSAPALGAFCSKLLRVYAVVMALRAGVVAWCVLNMANATTLDEEVLATKTNKALRTIWVLLSQLWLMKLMLVRRVARRSVNSSAKGESGVVRGGSVREPGPRRRYCHARALPDGEQQRRARLLVADQLNRGAS